MSERIDNSSSKQETGRNMRSFLIRLTRLLLGLFIYGFGIVFTINANIGYAPWDVFHAGLANTLGITLGNASIAVGVMIVLLAMLLGERVGLGTLLNMVLIGVFIDLIMGLELIPKSSNFFIGLLMMAVGMIVIAIATFFYIGSGFGAGPRDSLMVAVTRLTKLPVGICRATIEILAVLAGWLLGGLLGIGTVISALSIGFFIQMTFKVIKFDPTKVKHEGLGDTFKLLMSGGVKQFDSK